MKYSKKDYRNGAEGFILWAEENACVPIYPEGSEIPEWCSLGKLPDTPNAETGRSWKGMWEEQKKVLREALRMKNGRFVYRLIVFCWPRGEGKSILVVLIKLWRFMCWQRQFIMLGANSKDQVQWSHYELMRDIIVHSPKLLIAIGRKKVKLKDITLRNRKGDILSIIKCVSSFSGIFSNITGFTFSEMFDMKNPKFYVQIYGSIRNIPNALGMIDSTVSSKVHVLYRLFRSYQKNTNPALFFSYRYSKSGDPADYWNPNMTKGQLAAYKDAFPLGDYERYFLNLWSAGAENVFTEEMIEATNYIGADNVLQNHGTVIQLITKRNRIFESINKMRGLGGALTREDVLLDNQDVLDKIEARLWPVESVYKLRTPQSMVIPATTDDLTRLSDLYDTDWAILAGGDYASPMKRRTAARTILVIGAKGLFGSRSSMPILSDDSVPHYLYLLLRLANIEDHSLESMKEAIMEADLEYDGIDMFCSETWGAEFMKEWFEEKDIAIDIIHPTYDRQKAAFMELYRLYATGRFKAPPTAVQGSKEPDILREEPTTFNHNPDPPNRGFFSTEKKEKYGIQDDVMYALAYMIYGGRNLSVNDFKPRHGKVFFGELYQPQGLLGAY